MENKVENNIEEQIKDLEGTKQAEILLRMGISPRGVTGCTECDRRKFIYCKCSKSGGGEEESGETDDFSHDPDIDDTLDKFDSKTLKHSAPMGKINNHKMGKIPELTLSLENLDGKKLSDEEINILTKIFSTILTEFKAYISELKLRGISADALMKYTCSIENEHNDPVLKLHMPEAKHLKEFIQRMVDKKLWPEVNPEQQNLQQEDLNKTSYKSPSPFGNLGNTPILTPVK